MPPTYRVTHASLQWLDSNVPYSTQFDDLYFSDGDERGESQYVFVNANHLAERWQASQRSSFTIAEFGFGTGLNFLETWRAWSDCRKRPGQLHYVAFEQYPLRIADLCRVQSRWPALAQLCRRLQAQYPNHSGGCHRLILAEDVILDLHFNNAATALSGMSRSWFGVDCWYLDGFKPSHNPHLWSDRLFQQMTCLSADGATLSSYSVAGVMRERLAACGWSLNKVPGFGRKRHMLSGQLPPQSRTGSGQTMPRTDEDSNRHAVVVGAGLAGCSVAHSLARRGWQVTVLDSGERVAAGASGIGQLALRCRLFQQVLPAGFFFLHSFLFAGRLFSRLAEHYALNWHGDGSIRLQGAMNRRKPLRSQRVQELYDDQVVRPQDRQQLSELAGVALSDDGLYFPLAGWLNAPLLCQSLLAHPGIELRHSVHVASLQRHGPAWSAHASSGQELVRAPIMILAAGPGVAAIHPEADLPLQLVSGQSSIVAWRAPGSGPKRVVSGARSLFPALAGGHTVSASYEDPSRSSLSPAQRDRENLDGALASLAEPQAVTLEVVGHRQATRCNTPDHLPLIGPMPDNRGICADFTGPSGTRRVEPDTGQWDLEGLYVSAGHGSTGLASAPFAGECLAGLIAGECLPIDSGVESVLDPARFLRRKLARSRS